MCALRSQYRKDEKNTQQLCEVFGNSDIPPYDNGTLVSELVTVLTTLVDHKDSEELIYEFMHESDFGHANNARIRNVEDLWNLFHVGEKVKEEKDKYPNPWVEKETENKFKAGARFLFKDGQNIPMEPKPDFDGLWDKIKERMDKESKEKSQLTEKDLMEIIQRGPEYYEGESDLTEPVVIIIEKLSEV